MSIEDPNSAIDEAVARRLNKLGGMPVDTSSLERSIRSAIPPVHEARARRLWPARAVAASLIVFALIAAFLLNASSGPVMASTAQMVQMHDDLISGRTPSMKVDSVEAANRVLSSESPHAPTVPNAPQQHVMACCMNSIKNKKVSCVLLDFDGTPLSMMVANASDVSMPMSPQQTYHGVKYDVQSSGNLNMVMSRHGDRWICLTGSLPVERLLTIAERLAF